MNRSQENAEAPKRSSEGSKDRPQPDPEESREPPEESRPTSRVPRSHYVNPSILHILNKADALALTLAGENEAWSQGIGRVERLTKLARSTVSESARVLEKKEEDLRDIQERFWMNGRHAQDMEAVKHLRKRYQEEQKRRYEMMETIEDVRDHLQTMRERNEIAERLGMMKGAIVGGGTVAVVMLLIFAASQIG